MLEASVTSAPSIWATVNRWLTPSVFFVLLNLMIGTIFIISSLSPRKPKEGEEQEPHQQHHLQQQQQHYYEESPRSQQLPRSPSVLQRLKSIRFYNFRSQEPDTHFGRAPEVETHYGFLQQSPELEREQERGSEKVTPFLARSNSVLERLKSFDLYRYVSRESFFSPTHGSSEQPLRREQQGAQDEEEEQVDPAGDEELEEPELEDVEEEEEEEEVEEEEEEEDEQSFDDVYSQVKENHVERTKSDGKPASGEILAKLPRKMRKSASVKSAFAHFEPDDAVEARRPATVREGKGKAGGHPEAADEEVDAKADDFINRFKNQLKLQRLDSFTRYREMITRGSSR